MSGSLPGATAKLNPAAERGSTTLMPRERDPVNSVQQVKRLIAFEHRKTLELSVHGNSPGRTIPRVSARACHTEARD